VQALGPAAGCPHDVPPSAFGTFPRVRGKGTTELHGAGDLYGLVGSGAFGGCGGAGLLKSTVGAVEIVFSFSTEKFALVL